MATVPLAVVTASTRSAVTLQVVTNKPTHCESHCDIEPVKQGEQLSIRVFELDLPRALGTRGGAFESRVAEILASVDAFVVEAFAAAAAGKTLRVMFHEERLVEATYCFCGREALSVTVRHAWDRGTPDRHLKLDHLTWEYCMLAANSWRGSLNDDEALAFEVSELLKGSLRRWLPESLAGQIRRASWVHLLIRERDEFPSYTGWVDALREALVALAVRLELNGYPVANVQEPHPERR